MEGIVTFLGIFVVAGLWVIATELHKIRIIMETHNGRSP